MPVFTYRAINDQRHPCTGEVAANSPREARESLRTRGLVVLDVQSLTASPMVESASSTRPRLFARRVSTSQLASAIRELSTLIGVGIPLLESLDVLVRQYQGTLRTSLLRLRDRVMAGTSLQKAMAEQPEVFDTLSLNMVEVGERAGNLDIVLGQLADFKERSLDLRDRVFTAMMYPLVVLIAAIGVTTFLMTVVVPTLLENLLEANRPLPWATKVLKVGSDLLVHHGWWIGGVVALLAILGITWATQVSLTDDQPGCGNV